MVFLYSDSGDEVPLNSNASSLEVDRLAAPGSENTVALDPRRGSGITSGGKPNSMISSNRRSEFKRWSFCFASESLKNLALLPIDLRNVDVDGVCGVRDLMALENSLLLAVVVLTDDVCDCMGRRRVCDEETESCRSCDCDLSCSPGLGMGPGGADGGGGGKLL